MSAQTPKLDFAMLYVSHIDDAYAYFTQKLGFQPVPEESGPNFRYLRGDGGLDFALSQATPESAPAGSVHLYFKTPDLEGTRETYTQHGVEATPIMHMPFGSIFNVDAPDKHLVTIMS
jgi:catechol 2,3-dioxygenase-like lactoylglutathione lyase family enzyme